MRLIEYTDGFDLLHGGRTVLRHRRESPAIYLGTGAPAVRRSRGNFRLCDYVTSRLPLAYSRVSKTAEQVQIQLALAANAAAALEMCAQGHDGYLVITFNAIDPRMNRLWLRIAAEPDERFWGGGEQLSYFNLRGRHFPLWTSEPGVGRDKSTILTFKADQTAQAHCPLLWADGQSVDFSRHDGLQTVICAALSSGLLGNAYHHGDITGYSSLFGNVRTAELLQRWADAAAPIGEPPVFFRKGSAYSAPFASLRNF